MVPSSRYIVDQSLYASHNEWLWWAFWIVVALFIGVLWCVPRGTDGRD
jgi:uncharacterized membrane protein